MTDITYVSLFSGIEAFSVAASRIEGVRWHPVFFSEIEPFPCAVLAHHFPAVPNLGDICKIRVDREKGTITNGTATIPLPRTGIDILAGGSPCQDVSVAGKRAGMSEGSGTRSSLAFEYARLVEELRPRIVVWENVPGVLSSNGGLDFAAFLGSLVERGYSVAWRVLDAQYARVDGYPLAVPQRRRRVWLVGCLGADESVPAQILFERTSLLGDTPPRRTQGQGSASPSGYRSQEHDRVVGCAGGSGSDVSEVLTARSFKGIDARNGQISGPFAVVNVSVPSDCLTPGHPQTHRVYRADGAAYTLDAGERSGQDQRAVLVESASFDGEDVSATLHKPNGSTGYSDQEIFSQQGAYLARVVAAPSVCKTLSAEGFDGMPDIQKGNGMPVVAVRTAQTGAGGSGVADECAYTLDQVKGQAVAIGFKPGQSGREDTGSLGARVEECPTLPRDPGGMGVGVAISIDRFNQSSAAEVMHTLKTNSQTGDGAPTVAVGFSHVASGVMLDCQPKPCATPLKRSPGGEGAVTIATMLKVRCGKDTYVKPDGSIGTAGKGPLASEESAFTLFATQDQTLILNHIVRRLTPVECERLQGFPDGWTRIPWRIYQESARKKISYERLLAERGMRLREPTTEECPDSPRYKALGNSWATNCAEWVLRRIVAAMTLGLVEGRDG